MSDNRLTKHDIDRKYFSLSRWQRDDVKIFALSAIWTVPLLALHRDIRPSTANRRLHKLVAAEAIAVAPGHPWSRGGRTPDAYYLTETGAQLMALLVDDAPHVVAPDVTDEAAVTRHRVALELAIRGRALTRAHFGAQTVYTLRSGEYVMIQPALAFYDEISQREVFVEIARTDAPTSGVLQFEAYARLFADYVARSRNVPILLTVYPTREIETVLHREYWAAAAEAVRAYPDALSAFASVNLDTLREHQVASDLMQRLTYWFDGEVHHG